ncbi:MAG: hypothetical protein IPQ09_04920 [Myxococcales bacterium]|nr:hypothetical protein [Myxococcales bacterium]HQY64925.1 hypothetical protein [Polyangiaceae bacterium]
MPRSALPSLPSLARRALALALAACPAALAAGCSAETATAPSEDGADVAITSNDGKLFDFSFESELIAPRETPARTAIVAQLQYVQGALTTDVSGNAQIGLVSVTNVVESDAGGGNKRVRYAAVLPVIWPKTRATPSAYTLVVPRDTTALSAFNRKYDGRCGKNEYGVDTFWHDFNPKASGCTVDATDAVKSEVKITRSAKETTGKYPEYDQVLADDAIDVVAVFGIISSNTPNDEGAREMENVLAETERGLTGVVRKEGEASRSVIRSTLLTGTVDVGGRARKVTLTAMLTEELAAAGPDFDALYGPASEKADLIVYSGHSGLGRNIDSLAARTKVVAGKYQLVYLNGCQSFAYLGRGFHDKKIAANGAAKDPDGTKYLDFVANALPAYGDNGATGLLLYRALLKQDAPQTYNDLLKSFPRVHLAAVFGEDDNTFRPR